MSGVSMRITFSRASAAWLAWILMFSGPSWSISCPASADCRQNATTCCVVGRRWPDGERLSSPARALSSVDFPEPLGPTSVTTSLRSKRSTRRSSMSRDSSQAFLMPTAGRHREMPSRVSASPRMSVRTVSSSPMARSLAICASIMLFSPVHGRSGPGFQTSIRSVRRYV